MDITKPIPTATSPAFPTCTIIAANSIYHTYIREHWPQCVIKQSCDSLLPNYNSSSGSTSATISPSATPTGSPQQRTSLPTIIPLGVMLWILLIVLVYGNTVLARKMLDKRRRSSRRRHVGWSAAPNNTRTKLKSVGEWFGRKWSSFFNRNQERSLDLAVRLSSFQQGLQRVRTFGKCGPTVMPISNPRPNPVRTPGLNVIIPAGLPPAYQSAEHLPPPALPVPAYIAGQHDVVRDVPADIPARNERPRNEPPPPDYADRYLDPVYTSETESESDDDWVAHSYERQVIEIAVVNDEGQAAPAYAFDPWRGATRGRGTIRDS